MTKPPFKRAFLIDDNPIDNVINKRILENFNLVEVIVSYGSAREALTALGTPGLGPDLFPDLIFLDIRMPEMDGFEFLDEFSKLEAPWKNQCRIYVLSSSLDPLDQRKVTENKQVIKFIGKPLNLVHLKNLLKS